MKIKNFHQQQQAFISIFSVLVIMAILTLVAIGFSTITRRAQQRVLTNQLNTQAYYAAESGVNDAVKAIKLNPVLTKTSCQAVGDGFSYNNNLDAGLNVGYTCVLISNKDPKLIFTNVAMLGSSAAETTNLALSTAAPLKSFDITWSPHNNGGAVALPSTTTFPTLSTWTSNNYLGLVRVDLIPTNQLDRDSLAKNGYSFYIYGTSSAQAFPSGFVTTGTKDQGGLLLIKCNSSPCTTNITLGTAAAINYKLRLQSVYAPVDVTISNGKDTSGNTGNWVGGQAVIDVTGKANDVLRRIQVRVPLDPNGLTAPNALQTADSICKRLAASPGNTTVTDNTDSACRIE